MSLSRREAQQRAQEYERLLTDTLQETARIGQNADAVTQLYDALVRAGRHHTVIERREPQ